MYAWDKLYMRAPKCTVYEVDFVFTKSDLGSHD